MAFDAQITDLVGGTIDQTACDQWMEDGVRELINMFPQNLKEMCYTKNTFTSAAAGSEAETIASQHLGNVFAGSYVCRKISGANKYKASDSGDMIYATATDPAYYVEGGKLNILPASSSGVYYLIPDPSIDASAVSAISNFPNEAEYLVVLYAAIKQLLQYQSTMSSSFNSNIGTALGAITTELNKADDIILISYNKIVEYYTDIAELENSSLWDDTNKRFDQVRDALTQAKNLLDVDHADDDGNRAESAVYQLAAEDTELVASTLSLVQAEIGRASATAQEIGLLIQKHSLPLAGVPQLISTASGYISQANGYVAEATARLQSDSAKYQWYGDQYAKLSAEYARGLTALKGGQ